MAAEISTQPVSSAGEGESAGFDLMAELRFQETMRVARAMDAIFAPILQRSGQTAPETAQIVGTPIDGGNE